MLEGHIEASWWIDTRAEWAACLALREVDDDVVDSLVSSVRDDELWGLMYDACGSPRRMPARYLQACQEHRTRQDWLDEAPAS